jgi:hypothetical protein
MKVKLWVHKNGATLHEEVYDISDADSFGRACAQVRTRLRERRLAQASSIGALFDALDERLLDEIARS